MTDELRSVKLDLMFCSTVAVNCHNIAAVTERTNCFCNSASLTFCIEWPKVQQPVTAQMLLATIHALLLMLLASLWLDRFKSLRFSYKSLLIYCNLRSSKFILMDGFNLSCCEGMDLTRNHKHQNIIYILTQYLTYRHYLYISQHSYHLQLLQCGAWKVKKERKTQT